MKMCSKRNILWLSVLIANLVFAQEKQEEEVVKTNGELLFIQEDAPKVLVKDFTIYVQKKQYSLIEKKLQNGTDADTDVIEGNTIFHLGVTRSDVKLINLAGKYDASLKSENKRGETVMHLAAQYGNAELVANLLNHNKDVKYLMNKLTKRKRNVLHMAALGNKYENIGILASNGADVNAIDENGQTPLHYAAALGYGDVVIELLKNGANANIKSNNGDSSEKIIVDNINIEKLITISQYLSEESRKIIKDRKNNAFWLSENQ